MGSMIWLHRFGSSLRGDFQRWRNGKGKIRSLRQYLRGWSKNTVGSLRKEKYQLTQKLDELDKKAETSQLSPNELTLKIYIDERLTTILREEEICLFQRAKVKQIIEGNNNTKYFQLVANGKHKKQRIFSLEDDEGIRIEEADLKHHITNYHKTLFGKTDHNSVIMEESVTHDIPQVPDIENVIQTAPFTMDEVRKAVFQMERNKAPRPDGFSVEFYQSFWKVIKDDLIALFVGFHNDTLPVYSLNFGVINLLPKKCNASKIQEYRHICLLNVGFKIITKVLINKIGVVVDKLINPLQIAFMPGRNS
jgi:hypothetical protein